MNKTIANVIVHKANIPMSSGESIGMFTQKLSTAAREHTLGKLNASAKNGYAYLVEAYSDKVVMAAYKGDEPTKYYAFAYKRQSTGSFEFGQIYEMEKTISFKPKTSMVAKGKQEYNKSCGNKVRKECAAAGKKCSACKETTKTIEMPGWEVKKAFWEGIL